MFKDSFLKRAARKGLALAENWLQQTPTYDLDPKIYEKDDFAYRWMGAVLSRLHSEHGSVLRSYHTWGILNAAYLAKALGIPRISVLEFGVAGGNGLVAMEVAADRIEKLLGVGIDLYGFDTGKGLPKPQDYRDSPNLWKENAFPMDVQKLKARLKKAQLVLGLVEDTVPRFIESSPAPLGYMSVDVDYYSSTVHALKVLEASHDRLLPRVNCYLDDIMGFTHSEFTGERLAVAEFNARHAMRKIAPVYGLRYFLPPDRSNGPWVESFFIAHIFDHALYGHFDNLAPRQFSGGTDLR
jgi:hypothetical protein